MPNKKITYTCEYCYREFNTITECEAHECTHRHSYENDKTEKIIEELRGLSRAAYEYKIGNTVMGFPISNFESLMDEAAKRLENNQN